MKIFGIRHHGPGSARKLIDELQKYQPDCLLVEGPPDADGLLEQMQHPDMQPPVALLIYPSEDIERASFFPFAEFSPEWQAICWALKNNVRVQWMDLPMSQQFSLKEKNDAAAPQLFAENQIPDDNLMRLDPFRRIARLAGFPDPERWWDSLIERSGDADIFPEILELMTALRQDKLLDGLSENHETLLREAAMRQIIRAAQRDGYKKIAIVCGAWHAPALATVNNLKATDDANLIKTIKKKKTEALWIPYSFERLAVSSGYGAGVFAPFWYQILFSEGKNAVTRWMTLAAEVLRKEDLPVSPGHVIEAVRLADALAKLRGAEHAGIDELREAAQTVFFFGNAAPLQFLEQRLVIGQLLGNVPEQRHRCPLKQDFLEQIRLVGLKIKPNSEEIILDLRKEKHLQRSQILHRLILLGIGWGTELVVQGKKQGSFHEYWELNWQPIFEVFFIDKSIFGNTVESAAAKSAEKIAQSATNLTPIVALLERNLKANLPDTFQFLLHRLEQLAATDNDVTHLTQAVVSMASAMRYGQVRAIPLPNLEMLVERFSTRICLQLPQSCQFLDEEAANEMLKTMINFNRAATMTNRQSIENQWIKCLLLISKGATTAPSLSGLASRLLFDKNATTSDETAAELSFRLSLADETWAAACWIEGFLHGSGLLLVHHHEFWQILDDWLDSLAVEKFREVVPLLRRTFSKFEVPERQKMLAMAQSPHSKKQIFSTSDLPNLPAERMQALTPAFNFLRGMG